MGSLRLFTPLGNTVAELQWNAAEAVLRRGGEVQRYASLDALLADRAGSPIPVGALFAWLDGQAASVPGWDADLRQQQEGRIVAYRTMPLPAATLRVVLDR